MQDKPKPQKEKMTKSERKSPQAQNRLIMQDYRSPSIGYGKDLDGDLPSVGFAQRWCATRCHVEDPPRPPTAWFTVHGIKNFDSGGPHTNVEFDLKCTSAPRYLGLTRETSVCKDCTRRSTPHFQKRCLDGLIARMQRP